MAKTDERQESIFDKEQDGKQQPITDESLKAAATVANRHVAPGRMQGKAFEVVPWQYDSWRMMGNQPAHGKELITEKDILQVVNLFSDKIDKWAFILHDRDVYTKLDEKQNPQHKEGSPKPPHFHIMLLLRERLRLSQIAGWFNVALNQVERKGGKLDGPFIDMVEYMTHRRHPDKAPYNEAEIVSNVDVHALLLELEKKRALTVKYAKTTEDIQIYCDRVADGSMTLEQVRDEVGGYTYAKNERAFRVNRAYYLEKVAPLPLYRGNYYISGDSGEGKGVLAYDLACTLAGVSRNSQTATGEAVNLADYVFSVSPDERGRISFDGYDGQPVIVWEDITGADACRVLGGVKSTLQALEVHPRYRVKVDVKYGHATLINAFNIFCGTESYEHFLRGLVGWRLENGRWVSNGQPLKQTYRRVPVIINVHPTDFDILLRDDLTMDSGGDVMCYSVYKNVRGSYARIAKELDGACRDKYAGMLLPPVTEAVELARAKAVDGKITDPDADLPEFAGYGEVKTAFDLAVEAAEAQQLREAEIYVSDLLRSELEAEAYIERREAERAYKAKLPELVAEGGAGLRYDAKEG